MKPDPELFLSHHRHPNHYRLSRQLRLLVRTVLFLEMERIARGRERWLAQTSNPATDEPGVAKWLARHLAQSEATHGALMDLCIHLPVRHWLDSEIAKAMVEADTWEVNPDDTPEGGPKL